MGVTLELCKGTSNHHHLSSKSVTVVITPMRTLVRMTVCSKSLRVPAPKGAGSKLGGAEFLQKLTNNPLHKLTNKPLSKV